MNKQLIYGYLRNLRNKGIVRASSKYPAEFCAVPLDKALELLVRAHERKSQNIELEKNEILSQWRSIIIQKRKLTQGTRSKSYSKNKELPKRS